VCPTAKVFGVAARSNSAAAQAASLWGDAGFMNRIKFHVRKGDNVEVISGNFKGSSGKILEVIARKQQVLVEGVRIIKKHLRKSQDNPQGKIAEREGPIHISNVKFLERETKAEKKTKKKPEKKPEKKAA
jgi:large subunit ribosomal protein L24